MFKIETFSVTNLTGYNASADITEWSATLPARIDFNKIIAVNNINLGAWSEYINIDYASKVIRIGCRGNFTSTAFSGIRFMVAYFTN